MPFLDLDGEVRELAAGDTTVGSGTQAGWRVHNADLAARHFTITVHGTGPAMLRPASAHGIVVVNGRQVPQGGATVAHGDVIAAGGARFRFIEDRKSALPDLPAPPGEGYLINEGERVAYPLSKKTVSIGRDAASHVLVRDPSVSRFHADVRAEAGEYVLYAMGSAGTRVHGHGVSGPRLLEEGDEIGVGDQTFRFTRQPLPAGLTPVPLGGGEDDDRLTRRPTMMSTEAITGGHRRAIPGPTRRPVLPLVIAVVLVVVMILYWLGR